jgi:hypothetical protein
MKLFCYHYLKQEQVFDYSNAVNYFYPPCMDMYSSLNIVGVIKSRIMKWAGKVARMGERRDTYMVSVGSPEDKGPIGRPGCRWKDNIAMDLQEEGCGGLTGLIWLRIGTSSGHL